MQEIDLRLTLAEINQILASLVPKIQQQAPLQLQVGEAEQAAQNTAGQ